MANWRMHFKIVCSPEYNRWYWTCFLPTQISKVKTREEAILNMTRVIKMIQKGRFELLEHDLSKDIGQVTIPGGVRHLMSLLKKREPEKPKRKKRKAKHDKSKGLKRKVPSNLRKQSVGQRKRSRVRT